MRYITILLIVVLSVPVPAFAVSQLDTHTFPKLANYYLSWEIPQGDIDALAKWDVVVLDMEVQKRQPEVLRRLRILNPDIVLLVYITPQEIIGTAANSYSLMRRELVSRIGDDMYLYGANNFRLSWWQGTYLLNVSADSAWTSTLLTFVSEELLQTGYWDGVFYDNMWDEISYFVGNNVADMNRDGRPDSDADAKWKRGMEYIYTETKRLHPSAIVIGNGSTGSYDGILNGKMLENFAGGAAWQPTMQRYATNQSNALDPSVQIINRNTSNRGTASWYQAMRFGLTSGLLKDGYYSFDYGDTDHGQTWWYDEYNIDLGDAITDASSPTGDSNYNPGVWRRDFARGISLVNSDVQAKTISLGGEFEKITGQQDPRANDGAIVSSLTLAPEDGRILLKTTETVDDVFFTNGDFVRFLRADGTRVRNGFFVFDETERGGTQIARIDLNSNGKPEIITITGPKLEIYRDDGALYMKKYPYTASYSGEIRIAVGDLDRNGFKSIFVAPSPGYTLPIKVYARHGQQIKVDWYPFGETYSGGYSLAIGRFRSLLRNHLVIGGGEGSLPYVNVYNWRYEKERDWFAYDTNFTGGVSVATGDVTGDGIDEIITGPIGDGIGPYIKVYDDTGMLLNDFFAYTSLLKEGITVRTADVDFDGIDDILGFSSGVGL